MTSELPANLDLNRRHSDIRAFARRALSTNDTLDLAILGITGLYAMSEERLLQLLQHIGCPLFRPTPDLVLARMQTLMQRKLLASRRDGSGLSVLSPTPSGADHLRLLLATPGPAESAVQQDLAFLLKVCLLDFLGERDRRDVIRRLADERRTALEAAERSLRRCQATGRYTRLWLRREVERLNGDVAWLERLTPTALD